MPSAPIRPPRSGQVFQFRGTFLKRSQGDIIIVAQHRNHTGTFHLGKAILFERGENHDGR
jgi:hypothetical protein